MKGRKTGGRQKGAPNKATAEVKALAREYAPTALREIARLACEAESESVRVAACKEILDRAYGKATQPHSGSDDGEPFRISVVQYRVRTGVPRHDDQVPIGSGS